MNKKKFQKSCQTRRKLLTCTNDPTRVTSIAFMLTFCISNRHPLNKIPAATAKKAAEPIFNSVWANLVPETESSEDSMEFLLGGPNRAWVSESSLWCTDRSG